MKKSLFWIIASCFIILAFNVFFFVWNDLNHITASWISYGAIHLSFLFILFSPLFILQNKKSTHVFSESYALITGIYFIITLFVSAYFLYDQTIPYQFVLSAETCILCVYIFTLIITNHFNKSTTYAEEKTNNEVQFIKQNIKVLKIQAQSISDKKCSVLLEKLIEDLKYSPTISTEQTVDLESTIGNEIVNLKSEVERNDQNAIAVKIQSIHNLIVQRNEILKTN